MNDHSELHEGLAHLADLAADDGSVRRMSDRVAPMVARVRRRRAARRTGTGLAAVGTAAALVLGGFAVSGRQPVLPPATGDSTGAPAPVTCGEVAPDLPAPGEGPMAVVGFLGGSLSRPMLTHTLANVSGRWMTSPGPVVLQVLVMRGDRVVALATYTSGSKDTLPGSIDPGWHTAWSFQLPDGAIGATFATCYPGAAGGALPDGAYETRAVYTDAAKVLGSGGPWATTVSGGYIHAAGADAASEALIARSAAADARNQLYLQEYLAKVGGGSQTAAFPACGSTVPHTDPPLALALEQPAMRTNEGEAAQSGTVSVRATGGRTVLAEIPMSGALLVYALDGVVVGRGEAEPASGDTTKLLATPDSGQTIALRGNALSCATNELGVHAGLPAGTYEMYAVLDADLLAVTEPHGTTAPGGAVTVVSDLGGATFGR